MSHPLKSSFSLSLSVQESKSKEEAKELTEKLSKHEDLIDQHVRTIEKLESEKSDLNGGTLNFTLFRLLFTFIVNRFYIKLTVILIRLLSNQCSLRAVSLINQSIM